MLETNDHQPVQPSFDLDIVDEKKQRLEAERATLEKAVASSKFDTIQEKVAWILNHYPETRNSDITLQLEYWKRFESDLFNGRAIKPENLYELTRLTSLQRARAKIQNSYGVFQASPEVRRRRGVLNEQEKEKAVYQQVDIPTFAVYADESGKTQNHLVVGSVWFPVAGELGSLTLAIKDLKKQFNFGKEIHFKDINASKLPSYKAVADLLQSQASTFSFKAISVDRRGVGNVDRAVRDLYSMLLFEGAKHEIDNGRASLPRKLQFVKDAEEIGSDKLLLNEVKTRLVTAAKGYFDDTLEVDWFEVQDSRQSEILQLADLFTGSVSRRLNSTTDKVMPKDEFATYFLQAVGLNPVETKDEANGDVIYHLAL